VPPPDCYISYSSDKEDDAKLKNELEEFEDL
jgi:hypothetical protein